MADTPPNPFAPPRSRVDDIQPSGQTQPVKLWSASGRIGRLRLIAWSMFSYLVAGLVAVLLGVVAGASASSGFSLVSTLAVYGVCVVFGGLLTIQRCHDMNWTGWASLLAIIPLVGLIFWLVPGTAGENRFGAPPPPNPRGMAWLATLPLLLFILGIVAAIALPAYQGYAKRAAASQTR